MRHLKTLLTVLGAVTVLVLAGNTVALATTGQALFLGKVNRANKITVVKRTTSGPALNLATKMSSNPPFQTNGRGKVTNLNADKVDGLDSSVLRNRSYVFTAVPFTNANELSYKLNLPNGSYNVAYSLFFRNVEAGGIECYAYQDNTTGTDYYSAYSSLVHTLSGGWDPALSGAGLVTKSSTSTIYVNCDAQGSSTFDSTTSSPLQIVATPTTVVSSHVISSARRAIRRQVR